MANKKAKKPAKTLDKKAMKKTKGGAVDAFLKLTPTTSIMPTEQISLNFVKF